MKFIDQLPILPLAVAGVFLGLAPFSPEPHLFEKLRMLFEGNLTQTIDIFDLLMHSAPILLLAIKIIRSRTMKT